ncbi:MAG: YIP1 family protein [Theionarchaea archaeon]|nr:YIP1 family protein [Theionarchaea archaeon]MBU7038304.1 YIP1 family protein [Theionarchaea archaeon]
MLQILNPFKAGSEFQKLKLRKRWILAITIVLIPTILSTAGNYLVQQETQTFFQQLQEQEGSQSATQSQRQGAARNRNPMGMVFPMGRPQMEGTVGSSGTLTTGLVLGLIAALIYWVLKSVVFHIGSKILGGEGVNVSSTIHMTAYTSIPLMFKGILDLIKGITYDVPSQIGTFVPPTGADSLFLDFVRDHFTIFVVWAVLLMIVAVREQYSLSNTRALCVVLVPYVVVWILQLTLFSSGGFLGVI